jgi:hypothetical protein
VALRLPHSIFTSTEPTTEPNSSRPRCSIASAAAGRDHPSATLKGHAVSNRLGLRAEGEPHLVLDRYRGAGVGLDRVER